MTNAKISIPLLAATKTEVCGSSRDPVPPFHFGWILGPADAAFKVCDLALYAFFNLADRLRFVLSEKA